MTNRVVLAAAFAALFVAPAMAEEVSQENVTTAVVGGYAGWLWAGLNNPGYDPSGPPLTDAKSYILGLDAYLNHWLSGNTAVQLDLNGQISGPLEFDPSYGPVYGRWMNAAAHAAYRNPAQFAGALFGAVQSASYTAQGDDASPISYGVVGVEGQVYAGDLTFYGQAGIALSGTRADLTQQTGGARGYGDFAYVRGVVRYFPTDNLRLYAEALYGQGNVSYYTDAGVLNWVGGDVATTIAAVKLGGDYRPDDQKFSYFAAYDAGLNWQQLGAETRSSFDQRVTIGLKLDLDADSLKTRDRQGVTWDVPLIAGLVGQGNQLTYCFDECSFASPPP